MTTGKPAAVERIDGEGSIANTLASLMGCEAATLLPSTLHLFLDLFEVLRRQGIRLYVDAGAYPIARWGAERAVARGVPWREISHYDPEIARELIEIDAVTGLRPVIVADGFCPECGRAVPLRAYLNCVVPYGGYLVLDDTQALGIWGADPGPGNGYGKGGGGSLRWHDVQSPNVLVGSSLAKGFGVPLAALSGRTSLIQRFVQQSETRVRTSPPSIPALRAAEHAMLINARSGDPIRRRLWQLVGHFRARLERIGMPAGDGRFPMQMVLPNRRVDPVSVQRILLDAGVRTAVVHAHAEPEPRLLFVITARHTMGEIDRATDALARAVGSVSGA
jgi:8-amino-7-oxononanoate synthase